MTTGIVALDATRTMRTARWEGRIDLGGEGIECYVLDDETRVIGLSSAIRATAGEGAKDISKIAGVSGLRDHLDFQSMVAEFVEFEIPGFSLQNGKGMTTAWFERLVSAYVDAAFDPEVSLTPKQRATARQCQILQKGLIRTGLDALVDEATGYQKVRADDALQLKLRAFIAEDYRDWLKTFPDALWMEFGRLSGWKDPLKNRPQWWGKLVVWLIYETLDPDVAQYLKDNKPPTGVRWHQGLTSDLGVTALVARCYEVIGIAKTCTPGPGMDGLAELRDKVALHYGTKPLQLALLDGVRSNPSKRRKRSYGTPVQGTPEVQLVQESMAV